MIGKTERERIEASLRDLVEQGLLITDGDGGYAPAHHVRPFIPEVLRLLAVRRAGPCRKHGVSSCHRCWPLTANLP